MFFCKAVDLLPLRTVESYYLADFFALFFDVFIPPFRVSDLLQVFRATGSLNARSAAIGLLIGRKWKRMHHFLYLLVYC